MGKCVGATSTVASQIMQNSVLVLFWREVLKTLSWEADVPGRHVDGHTKTALLFCRASVRSAMVQKKFREIGCHLIRH